MRRYSLGFFIKHSISGLIRNAATNLGAIAILASCLLVIGVFSLFMLNVNSNLQVLDSVNVVTVFIDFNTPAEREAEIGDEIQLLDNVKTYSFVSKEEALKKVNDKFGEIIDLTNNPLRSSYEIEYEDVNGLELLIHRLKSIDDVAKIRDDQGVAKQVASIKKFVTIVFVVFFIVLLIVSIIVIYNAIKISIHSRKSEIFLMRYLGSTSTFIVIPFLIEGAIIGIIAAAVAFLIQWQAYSYLAERILKSSVNDVIKIMPFSEYILFFALAMLACGVLIGMVGSFLSVKKHMKV